MKQKPRESFHTKIKLLYPQECTTVVTENILPRMYTCELD